GVVDEAGGAGQFVLGHFQHQLVVDLQEQPGPQPLLPQAPVGLHHGQLDDVGRGALDGAVHGGALREVAPGPVAGTQVGQIAAPAKKGGDVAPLPGGFDDRVDVAANARVALEIVVDVALRVLPAQARPPGQAKAADAVDDAKVDG